jgi:hypothetical protein
MYLIAERKEGRKEGGIEGVIVGCCWDFFPHR